MDRIYDGVNVFVHEQKTNHNRYYVVSQEGNCPVHLENNPQFLYSDFEFGTGLSSSDFENQYLFNQKRKLHNWKLLYIRTINGSSKNSPTSIEQKDDYIEIHQYFKPLREELFATLFNMSRTWVLVHRQNQLLVRIRLHATENKQGTITGK